MAKISDDFSFFFLAQFVLSLTEPSWRTFKAPQKSRIRTKTLLSRVNRSLFGGVIGSRSWKWLSKWVCSGITSSVELRRGGSGGRWAQRKPAPSKAAPIKERVHTIAKGLRYGWRRCAWGLRRDINRKVKMYSAQMGYLLKVQGLLVLCAIIYFVHWQ